jgi:hypothetical protein
VLCELGGAECSNPKPTSSSLSQHLTLHSATTSRIRHLLRPRHESIPGRNPNSTDRRRQPCAYSRPACANSKQLRQVSASHPSEQVTGGRMAVVVASLTDLSAFRGGCAVCKATLAMKRDKKRDESFEFQEQNECHGRPAEMAPATQAARHSRPSSPLLPALDAMWDQAVEKRGHTLRCRNHTFSPSVLPRGGTELILTSLKHCQPCFGGGHARTHAGQSGMRPWRLVVLPPTWTIATSHDGYLN